MNTNMIAVTLFLNIFAVLGLGKSNPECKGFEGGF